ncbi:MAG: DUF2306 domain-containing protein [Pyrinomonadaceae bacterium]
MNINRLNHQIGFEPPALKKALTFFFWAVIFGLIFYFYGRMLGKFAIWEPRFFGPFWPERYWLIFHIIGGSIALLSGPFQFFELIRNNYRRAHRALGRFYVAGVGIGAVGAFYLSTHPVIGWMVGVMLFTGTVMWVGCTAMGVVSILKGRVIAHREWMVRSYLLTFAFVLFRLLTLTPLFAGTGVHERYTTLGWLSFIIPMAVAELCFQWRRSVTRTGTVYVAENF